MHHIKRSSGPQDTTHVQAPGGATHMADLPTNRTAGGADAAPSTEQVATALSNFSISSGETVSFKTSTGTKLFFAHEDLLCRRSNFFRLSLQKKRKVIDEDCLVCLEELDARKADIVWCKTTGGKNFHADCIKRWHQSSILCPGCKQRWASQTPNTLTIPAVLEEAVLQDYLDSIYANNIRTPPGLAVHDGTLSLWLFQMWEICNVLQDFELRKMIVSRHMGMCLGMDTSYWLASVKFTPPRLPRHERIRAYIVDVFVWKNDLDFFEHHA